MDNHRKSIKECVDALKNAGDWLGLPFDLEWVDVLQRLPRLQALYRASLDNRASNTVEEASAQWTSTASEPVLLTDSAAASKHH